MINNLFRLTALTLFISCNPGRQLEQTSVDLMTPAPELTFNSYFSKSKIPRDLYKNYRKIYENGMLMADKKDDFNPLDVQEKSIPSRRFIFGANSVSNYYELFVYEEGGVGVKNYCIISKKEEGGRGNILRVYLFRRANDINELKEIIAKKEYRISNQVVSQKSSF